MSKNKTLSAAKSAKNDEFYTQYADIQKEINAYLDHDTNASGRIDLDDLEWEYLEGDGDFRSEEVSKLRDEADVIVTNPPFSLFREFLAWILGTGDFLTQRRREAEGAERQRAQRAV